MTESELREVVHRKTADLIRLQELLDQVWDDVPKRAEVLAAIQESADTRDEAARQLWAIVADRNAR